MNFPKANPEVIDSLVNAIQEALCDEAVEGVTTAGEILSSLLTTTHWFLSELNSRATPAERQVNSAEITRVLSGMLLEFGCDIDPKKVN